MPAQEKRTADITIAKKMATFKILRASCVSEQSVHSVAASGPAHSLGTIGGARPCALKIVGANTAMTTSIVSANIEYRRNIVKL